MEIWQPLEDTYNPAAYKMTAVPQIHQPAKYGPTHEDICTVNSKYEQMPSMSM
jgi:hypothetical protein